MAKIVEITQSSDSVTCDENGQAVIQFNITNTSASSLRVAAKVVTDDPEQQSWYRLEGKSEKKLDVNATDQFTVMVSAENADTGEYKLKLLVYNVENSDEEYTESGAVEVRIPVQDSEPKPEPSSKMWIVWVLLGILVVAILAGIGYVVISNMNKGGTEQLVLERVPDVTGKLFEQAKIDLENLGFTKIEFETRFDVSKAQNTVLEQTPVAGSKEDISKTEIMLILADSATLMPDVIDMTFKGAADRLRAKGFNKIKKEPQFNLSKPAGTVLDQSPAAETSVNSNETEVALTIADHGVVVPNLKDMSLRNAINKLTAVKLSVDTKITSKLDKTKNEDTVISQNPAAGSKIEEGTAVKIVVSTKKQNWIINPIILQNIQVPLHSRRELPPAE